MLYALSWFFVSAFLHYGRCSLGSACRRRLDGLERRCADRRRIGCRGSSSPEWLVPWVPPEIAQAMTSLLSGFAPVVESRFRPPRRGWRPDHGDLGNLGPGSALLLLLGAGLICSLRSGAAQWCGDSGPQSPSPVPHDGNAVLALARRNAVRDAAVPTSCVRRTALCWADVLSYSLRP